MRKSLLFAACVLVASLAHGGGREVLVAVGLMGSIQGELVVVGDTSLVVAVEIDDESRIGNDSEILRNISLTTIKWVLVKEQDNVEKYAGLGILSGGILGGVVGASTAERPPGGSWGISPGAAGALGGGAIGAMIGLGLGLGIGYALSSDELRLEPGEKNFREELRQFARYPLAQDSFPLH